MENEATEREQNFNRWLQEYQAGIPTTISPLTWMRNPPTDDQMEAWRQQYGEICYVVIAEPDDKVTMDSVVYLYRGLLYREYTEIMETAQSQAHAEEESVKLCVLHPKIVDAELPTLPAGIVATLWACVEKASMWFNQRAVGKL